MGPSHTCSSLCCMAALSPHTAQSSESACRACEVGGGCAGMGLWMVHTLPVDKSDPEPASYLVAVVEPLAPSTWRCCQSRLRGRIVGLERRGFAALGGAGPQGLNDAVGALAATAERTCVNYAEIAVEGRAARVPEGSYR